MKNNFRNGRRSVGAPSTRSASLESSIRAEPVLSVPPSGFGLAVAFGLLLGICSPTFADDLKPITPIRHIELFNGKDFSGWTFCLRSNAAPEKTWSVTNGLIHCTGRPFGYARTVSAYHDYELTVEWRFVKIAPRADNTGIFLHINPPDRVWPTCVEAQGQHGHQGDLRMNGAATAKNHDTPQTKNADAQNPSNENPVGEWNTLRAECPGDVIRLYTNGKLMNEITGCSVSSGAIGIQSEGGEIEVRTICLDALKTP